MSIAPRRLLMVGLPLATLLILSAPQAGAVKREVIRDLQEEIAGHSYRLRIDLQGTNYLSVPNVVTSEGLRYRGRQFPVLFRQMEMVYVERISNDAGKAVSLTLYRNRKEAEQVRGAIPPAPFTPGGPGTESALGSFARDLSTTVILELSAGKDDPRGQREEILQLLHRVFYLKEDPTFQEKETFVLSHADLPVSHLADATGLPEEVIREILKRSEEKKEGTEDGKE